MTDKEAECRNLKELRHRVIGVDKKVPLITGESRPYINFDNAASTPTFSCIWNKLHEFMNWYSNVHRGTGFKSQLATWAFDGTREKILRFVGANPDEYVVIFGKNTSEMVNHLAYRLPPVDERDIVLTTMMEHHSNDLPWRKHWKAVHVAVDRSGHIDREDLEKKIKKYARRIRLLAVSGASNVTGIINPVHEFARMAHEVGAEIMVDGAQLIPHRKVRMQTGDGEEAIDYLVFSAHKMYAPFGIGVLVGKKRTFAEGEPVHVGGGTIEIVTLDRVEWAPPPERDEAGTPNIPGAIALGIAIDVLQGIGMDKIAKHEKKLTRRTFNGLRELGDEVQIIGPEFRNSDDRLGVITFNLNSMPHSKLAAILSWEWAIGVRNGCFCAHPYLTRLMDIRPAVMQEVIQGIRQGDRSHVPGAVRISFGCYNTVEEVDYFLEALEQIAGGNIRGNYRLNPVTGEYWPEGWTVNFEQYFPWRTGER